MFYRDPYMQQFEKTYNIKLGIKLSSKLHAIKADFFGWGSMLNRI